MEKLFVRPNDILVSLPKSSSEYAQSNNPLEPVLDNLVAISFSQRRPNPDVSRSKIPIAEWPNVVRRVVENQEPLRKVAADYGVSYETIRRTVRAARK